jgi:hypothetical protein
MDHFGEFRIHIKCDAMGITVLVLETLLDPSEIIMGTTYVLIHKLVTILL